MASYNRGNITRGYGGHRGGGTRGTGNYDGLIKVTGTDRYCTACGRIIKGLATTMIAICPHNTCGAPIPFRAGPDQGEFDVSGWGRCQNCKSFLFKDHVFCQSCSQVNTVAKEKLEHLKKKALLEEKERMMKINREKDDLIAKLLKEKEELSEMVGKQETELFNIKAQKGITGSFDEDDLDASLSQMDESLLNSSNVEDKGRHGNKRNNDKSPEENLDEGGDDPSVKSAKLAH